MYSATLGGLAAASMFDNPSDFDVIRGRKWGALVGAGLGLGGAKLGHKLGEKIGRKISKK